MALVPGFFSCLRGVAKVLKRTDVECFGRRLLDGSRLQIYADWSRRGEGWATCRLRQCPSSADKSQQRYEERFQVPVLSRTREFDKSSVSICEICGFLFTLTSQPLTINEPIDASLLSSVQGVECPFARS